MAKPMQSEIVGTIAPHPRRTDHLALFLIDGTLSTTFAVNETLAKIAVRLSPFGYIVNAAATVTRPKF